MQSEPREDRPDPRIPPPLGLVRQPNQEDPRLDSKLLAAVGRIAPGTELRQGIDDIIRSREGALIVIGEPPELEFLFSGGIRLDQPFTPQLLYELAKMDGAIIVNSAATKLVQANVQLMPDPTIPSAETGTRHRTAERVAKQTRALVISISQQRETVTVFLSHSRYQLEPIADVLAKTNQALATLETYRARLEQVLTRLTALEFQNAVMLDDVLVTVQRAELVADVPDEKGALVYDYHADGGAERTREGLEALAALPYDQLLEFELLAVLGYPATVNPLDHGVSPRGLEAVEGVGSVRAREIREGLRRLQEHNLVDRYLQI